MSVDHALDAADDLDTEEEVSRDTIAGGILAGGRNVTGLTKTDRYHLRIAIEQLVADGYSLNDILSMCDTNRAFYFNQIDTIRELPVDPKQLASAGKEREQKKEPPKRMTYEEKLHVIDQVDHLRYIVGLDLRDACSRSGLSLNKYYKLTLNRKSILEAISRGLGNTSDAPRRKRRMRIPDASDHEQRLSSVEKIRRCLTEGANLEAMLERGGIPKRLYLKWATESEQAATAAENVQGAEFSDTLKLWQAYTADKQNIRVRNLLLTHYLPMVRTIAEKVSLTLPQYVSVNDLVQEGTFGLLDAIEAFDPSRGTAFRQYATPRIWGSIMDYLRDEDWAPRTERAKYNQQRDAAQQAYERDGHEHPEDPIEGGSTASSGNGHAVFLPKMMSMSKPYAGDDGKPMELGDTLKDETSFDPSDRMSKQVFLRFILQGCNRAERLIMILYYYEEQTMKEIGETLDLSESRVSQMHSAIIERQNASLRSRLIV